MSANVPFTDRHGRPYDLVAEREEARAAQEARNAYAAATRAREGRPDRPGPVTRPPDTVPWADVRDGEQLTPAQVRQRAEERGAEALRRQDAQRERTGRAT